jgi:hypothetical protein
MLTTFDDMQLNNQHKFVELMNMWQVDACIIVEKEHDVKEHLMPVVEQREHVDHE